jgi:predicted nucleic acid-binding protein
MNIFIDTSILYSDPFWQENFPNQLMNVARDKRVNIYISDIVLKELRHNFEKELDKELFELRKRNNILKKFLRRFEPYVAFDKESCLLDFDNYYKDIANYNYIKILNYKPQYLSAIVDKAIIRQKPFSEKKTELKDALIWLTYSDFANTNNLENCYFLTENCSDFCDLEKLKSGVFELHSDLKNECDKFKIFRSIKDFYKANSDWLDKPIIELKQWIESQNIDDEYVFDLLWKNETDKINSEIQWQLDKINLKSLFNRDDIDFEGGYIDTNEIEWYDCNNIEIEVVSDYAIVTGFLTVYAKIQAYGYNSERDQGDDKFPLIGDLDLTFEVLFSFTLEKEKAFDNFEVHEIIKK